MNYNDEFKRIGGHEPMKEIPESFESDEVMAAAKGRRTRRNGAAAMGGARASRSGFNAGSILAAIGAVVIAGVVFYLSDSHFFGKSGDNTARNNISANADADRMADYAMVEVTEITTVPASATATQAAATDATYADAPNVVCLFPLNGDAIQENSELNALAQEAVKEDANVVVTGYTDDSGSVAYNNRLSERRAEAIGNYLVAHGVPRNHITVRGCGPTHAYPTAALDRRVEVRVV